MEGYGEINEPEVGKFLLLQKVEEAAGVLE